MPRPGRFLISDATKHQVWEARTSAQSINLTGMHYGESPEWLCCITKDVQMKPRLPHLTPMSIPPKLALQFRIDPELPSGLAFSEENGAIAGHPTCNGESRHTITAFNEHGCTRCYLSIMVCPAVPEGLHYEPAVVQVRDGASYQAVPYLSPGFLRYEEMEWTVEPPFPGGMEVDPETGKLSGTVEEAMIGFHTYSITAKNASGHVSGSFFIEVVPDPNKIRARKSANELPEVASFRARACPSSDRRQ